ncbi:Fe repressor of activation 2 [Trichinella pseudospiralis]|uniref:Fe repressor of activation 2 n=1 Tax=Trichinella pseudospiralis TaxID=6337 RepID=A0A0V1EN02_TRIPS|nr:Fe repressor of activation 2 [Trichinella pseudospiralis]
MSCMHAAYLKILASISGEICLLKFSVLFFVISSLLAGRYLETPFDYVVRVDLLIAQLSTVINRDGQKDYRRQTQFCVATFAYDKMSFLSALSSGVYKCILLERRAQIKGLEVVNDVSDGCGLKYNLLIVSETFKDKLVQSILREEMPSIHALSISTYTPDEWNKLFYVVNKFVTQKREMFSFPSFQLSWLLASEVPIDEEMHSSSEDGWNAFEQHHDVSRIMIC